jgi:hypothetical protein
VIPRAGRVVGAGSGANWQLALHQDQVRRNAAAGRVVGVGSGASWQLALHQDQVRPECRGLDVSLGPGAAQAGSLRYIRRARVRENCPVPCLSNVVRLYNSNQGGRQ